MPQSFDIDVVLEAGELVVRASGELDLNSRSVLVEKATAPLTNVVERVVVDMGDVTFCDSSGLAALLDIRRVAGGAGTTMVLRNVPAPVARLLDLTDVDGWLARE